MAHTVLFSLLLLCTASLSSALYCYQCSGCDEGQRGHPVQCSSSQDSCLKVVLGSRIEKSCAYSPTCTLGDVEKSLTDVFKDLSSSITGNERDGNNDAQVMHCCTSDYCNAASAITPFTALLLVAPLVMGTLMG